MSCYPLMAYFGYYSNLYDPFLNHTLCKRQQVIEKYPPGTDPGRMIDDPHCCFGKQPPDAPVCFVACLANLIIILTLLVTIWFIIIILYLVMTYLIRLCRSVIREQFSIYQETLTEISVINHDD